MGSTAMFYTFMLFFASAYAFSIKQTVGAGNTVLNLLEGNVTGPQFDDDGKDFDIFSYLFAVSSRDHRLNEDIPGDITVLAPDDNAFRRAVGDLGLKTSSELETYENFLLYMMNTYLYPIDFLTRILYYHIVPGELNSTAALQLPSLATWDEPSRITRDGNTLIDRNPELRNPSFDTERMDIQASNGIIHVIDYVLFPEVIRKLDRTTLESMCSTPEASLEDSLPQGDVGPLFVEESPGTALMDEAITETGEPSQNEEIPMVTTLPVNIDVTLSPSTVQSEPPNQDTSPSFDDNPVVTTLPVNMDVTLSPSTVQSESPNLDTSPSFDDGELEENVMPSQEITLGFTNGNGRNGGENTSPSFSQQEPSDTKPPQIGPSMSEELQNSETSSSPISVTSIDISQTTAPDASPEVVISPFVEADNVNPQASSPVPPIVPQTLPDSTPEEPFQLEPLASFAGEDAVTSAAVVATGKGSPLPSPTCGSSSHGTS